jgi:hypothetical protein
VTHNKSNQGSGPKLKVLMTHASGLSAFEEHSFEDVTAARAFFDYRFRGHAVPGVSAFWALTTEPLDQANREPTLIIRDPRRREFVYSFGFADMEAALDYIREEIPNGLDLANVELYWASPVKIALDNGAFELSPALPPRAA